MGKRLIVCGENGVNLEPRAPNYSRESAVNLRHGAGVSRKDSSLLERREKSEKVPEQMGNGNGLRKHCKNLSEVGLAS